MSAQTLATWCPVLAETLSTCQSAWGDQKKTSKSPLGLTPAKCSTVNGPSWPCQFVTGPTTCCPVRRDTLTTCQFASGAVDQKKTSKSPLGLTPAKCSTVNGPSGTCHLVTGPTT